MFSCHVSLGTFGCEFLRLSLFLMTLMRSTGQLFCGMSLNWDFSDVFLMVRLGI